MSSAAFVLLAQLAAAGVPGRPVLQFPEPSLDDSAAYSGYTTRFFRDVDRSSLQIYLDRREGRVVHLFANGENPSIGFSARTPDGEAADLRWNDDEARVARDGRRRSRSYVVTSPASELHLGRFLLGPVRVERDVPYFREHRRPCTDEPYVLAEYEALLTTTGRALTPLTRDDIFTADFLQWAESAVRAGDLTRARWIARQIADVELLASRDKLMAGLPSYATYFGRDMPVSALMMRPVWRPEMNAFVIGAALRKLAPNGEVSHEEALGDQVVREAAAEYVAMHARADTTRRAALADSLRAQAHAVRRARCATRENYHMVDDEYQLPILLARYLDDPQLSAARKRAWLEEQDAGSSCLPQILAALNVVATRTAAYAANPAPRNLVSFSPRDATADSFGRQPRWFAQSWRDSGAGYGNGRHAMDVNAIYVPHALAALQRILTALRALGLEEAVRQWIGPLRGPAATLAPYMDNRSALDSARPRWEGAVAPFVVRRSANDVRQAVAARVGAMPPDAQALWRAAPLSGDSPEFLALALDERGTPIVVANDAYARPPVWQAFDADPHPGPQVVWGREVNLVLQGNANHLPLLSADPDMATLLRNAATAVRNAVAASELFSERWRVAVADGRPVPQRYGSGADVQLWSTTDLAVQYVWSRLPR